jgi:sugar lactone lactonase YvrE
MRRSILFLVAITAAVVLVWIAGPAVQADAGGVVRFATLPPGAPGHPEGLTADAAGNIYAASFELAPVACPGGSECPSPFPRGKKGPQADPSPPFAMNYIYTFGHNGRMTMATPLPFAEPAPGVFIPRVPLGMVVAGNKLYVNDVFNGDLLQYSLPLTPTSLPTVYDVCGGFVVAFGSPGEFCALNANDEGPDGRIYISDNGAGDFGFTNGRIMVVDPAKSPLDPTAAAEFYDGDAAGELNVSGFPPFGVNGVAFSPDGSVLYLANMSTDTIYTLAMNCNSGSCVPGALTVFAEASSGIDGPDNIDVDANGNLWVASGQNDRAIAFNPQGDVIRTVGSFEGFSQDGAPKGLLQPSGIVFANGKIYVGNEANPTLRQDSASWSGSLKLFTLSRLNP